MATSHRLSVLDETSIPNAMPIDQAAVLLMHRRIANVRPPTALKNRFVGPRLKFDEAIVCFSFFIVSPRFTAMPRQYFAIRWVRLAALAFTKSVLSKKATRLKRSLTAAGLTTAVLGPSSLTTGAGSSPRVGGVGVGTPGAALKG
jgi:hypothetical protein